MSRFRWLISNMVRSPRGVALRPCTVSRPIYPQPISTTLSPGWMSAFCSTFTMHTAGSPTHLA